MPTVAKDLFTPGNINKVVTIPDIAWPTIFLFVVAFGVHIFTLVNLYLRRIPEFMACAINTFAIFAVFTPMHDASHGSVAKHQYNYINSFIGHLAGCCFPLPYGAFKYLHYQHHKHTNEEGLDPDLFVHSGGGALLSSSFLFPVKFFSLEFFYYYMYLSRLFTRPVREAVPALLFLVCTFSGLGWAYCNSTASEEGAVLWKTVLWGWLIPGRFALALLAVFFDYLPHAPFVVRRDDPYKSTCVLSLGTPKAKSSSAAGSHDESSDPSSSAWWLTWPLLHQNYHNIHHHAPYVPFYLYSELWRAWKWQLLDAGTEVHSILQ